jgi:hypothetical protein
MRKKTGVWVISLFIAMIIGLSCKKAGSGGKAEVAVYVSHHGNLIPGATVYVKYNEKEFPGEELDHYNTSAVCGVKAESKGHTHIKGLRQGYYYFYAVGFDSSISQKVSGGISLHISYSERKKEKRLEIPVTE